MLYTFCLFNFDVYIMFIPRKFQNHENEILAIKHSIGKPSFINYQIV